MTKTSPNPQPEEHAPREALLEHFTAIPQPARIARLKQAVASSRAEREASGPLSDASPTYHHPLELLDFALDDDGFWLEAIDPLTGRRVVRRTCPGQVSQVGGDFGLHPRPHEGTGYFAVWDRDPVTRVGKPEPVLCFIALFTSLELWERLMSPISERP